MAAFFGSFALAMLYSGIASDNLHMVARMCFIAFASLLAWHSATRVWAWTFGGTAELYLTSDPVPHGRKVALHFKLARRVTDREWSVKVNLLGPQDQSSGFGTKWSEAFPVQVTDSHELTSTIFIPAHVMHTRASTEGELHVAMLTLKSGSRDWLFRLETQSERPQGDTLNSPWRLTR